MVRVRKGALVLNIAVVVSEFN
ncbi:MAG: hypothetical protein KC440_04380, partial [Nitrosarchaeum sp.]|nr:hypothetical protein [Nitrosarchaeum sp.]